MLIHLVIIYCYVSKNTNQLLNMVYRSRVKVHDIQLLSKLENVCQMYQDPPFKAPRHRKQLQNKMTCRQLFPNIDCAEQKQDKN